MESFQILSAIGTTVPVTAARREVDHAGARILGYRSQTLDPGGILAPVTRTFCGLIIGT